MSSRTRTVYPHGLNNGFSSEFPLGYLDRYNDEGHRGQQSKCCVTNNKNENNNLQVNSVHKKI